MAVVAVPVEDVAGPWPWPSSPWGRRDASRGKASRGKASRPAAALPGAARPGAGRVIRAASRGSASRRDGGAGSAVETRGSTSSRGGEVFPSREIQNGEHAARGRRGDPKPGSVARSPSGEPSRPWPGRLPHRGEPGRDGGRDGGAALGPWPGVGRGAFGHGAAEALARVRPCRPSWAKPGAFALGRDRRTRRKRWEGRRRGRGGVRSVGRGVEAAAREHSGAAGAFDPSPGASARFPRNPDGYNLVTIRATNQCHRMPSSNPAVLPSRVPRQQKTPENLRFSRVF